MPIPDPASTFPPSTATRAKSVIVYGPQGSGKTTHAPALAAHFGLQAVEDNEGADMYRQLKADPYALQRFLDRGVLALTHVAPPDDLADCRRILHIRDALRVAGINTHRDPKGRGRVMDDYENREAIVALCQRADDVTNALALLRRGMDIANRACIADIESECPEQLVDGIKWRDTRPMLSPHEHAPQSIDLASQALQFALDTQLIELHPLMPHLVRIVHRPD